MSTLISSAVGGKRTAPKAAPRRRAPPLPPPAAPARPPPQEPSPVPEPEPEPEPEQPADLLLPPPPPTQQPPAGEQSAPPAPPRHPPAAAAREEIQPTVPPQPGEQPAPVLAPAPAPASVETQQSESVAPTAVESRAVQQEGTQATAPATRASKRKRNAAAAEGPAQAPKRARRSSARSSADVQARVHDDETSTTGAIEPQIDPQLQREAPQPEQAEAAAGSKPAATRKAPAKRRGRAKSAATVRASEGEGPTGAQAGEDARRKKPAKRRSKKAAAAAVDAAGEDGAERAAGGEPADADEESDPELHEIDPNTVTMMDLSRANKHGKTSEREAKMAEINWAEVMAKRREEEDQALEEAELQKQEQTKAQMRAHRGASPVRPATEGPDGAAEPHGQDHEQQDQEEDRNQAAQPQPGGLGDGLVFKLVNGEIVADESSLTITNQAQAQAEADAATTEAVEENDLTVRINNASFMNSRKRDIVEKQKPAYRSKSDPWSDQETERFYDALRMFGTDFLIVSKMFPGKTRAQIKKKFVREERIDLVRINNALLGKDTSTLKHTPMSLDYYAKETGRERSAFTKYATADEAVAEIRKEFQPAEDEARERMQAEEEDKRQRAILEEGREKGARRRGGKKKEDGVGGGGGGGGGKGKGKRKGGAGLGGGGPAEDGG